jgi:histidine triad (HIT) family protein
MADSLSGCPFCKLDEPAVTVYRDATVQAFISLAPINRYHVIVAPRAHFEHLTEMPTVILTAAVSLAQRLGAAIAAVARPDALTLLSDDDLTGMGLNQVAHWKLHLIPRYRGDRVVIQWNRAPDPGPDVRGGYAEAIRRVLSAT